MSPGANPAATASDLPLYRHLDVTGYWNLDGRKLSKSLGNAVSPLALKERFGDDHAVTLDARLELASALGRIGEVERARAQERASASGSSKKSILVGFDSSSVIRCSAPSIVA